MKKLLFILSIFISTFCAAQNRHTGAFVFEVQNYGAVRDSTIDNTSYIQRTMDSAHAKGGGAVHIPYGVWGISKLILYNDVKLYGDGLGTVLKARTADTMIVSDNRDFANFRSNQYGYSPISDLFLEGHGTAVVGISFQYLYWFTVNRVVIDSCTSIGMYLKGALTGSFNDVMIKYCPSGAVLDSFNVAGSTAGPVSPNLISFRNCRFYFATSWGFTINFSQGNVAFYDCDFENDGTLHNPATGALKETNGSTVGIYCQNTWFEANKGTVVSLGAALGTISHTFRNCQMVVNGSASVGIEVNAPNYRTYLILDNTPISSDSLDIYLKSVSSVSLFTQLQIITMGFTFSGTITSPTVSQIWVKNFSYEGISSLTTNLGVPTIVAKSGAGTSPTISMGSASTNIAGSFSVTTGSAPVASDTLAIITAWYQTFATGSDPIITPGNANAAGLAGTGQIWANATTNKIYILTNSTPLEASKTYIFHYIWPGK